MKLSRVTNKHRQQLQVDQNGARIRAQSLEMASPSCIAINTVVTSWWFWSCFVLLRVLQVC